MPLPGGTITFLFTDIEGSTRLWEEQPEAMQSALARHDALLRVVIEARGGVIFKTIGDAFCAAFATAPQALEAALLAQQSLSRQVEEGDNLRLSVRMALHTGAAEFRDNDYFGPPLNRVARLLAAGHGGQTLLTLATQELTRDTLPDQVHLHTLGEHRLRDLTRPEQVFQLLHPDLPTDFPPIRSLNNAILPNNLPQQLTSFIGREKEMVQVTTLLAHTRLLTLLGAGGSGKTRLSLQVAADLLDDYPDGVWLIELAPLSDPALVPQTVAQALGVKEQAGQSFLQSLVEGLKGKRLLLLLDNGEHVLSACAQLVATLLRSCIDVKILVTSREAMNIAGEQTYRVPSLSLPDPKKTPSIEAVTQYEAVQLFIERARLVKSDFAVTSQNAPALAQLCYRLDGIPLAIELAAARVRALSVEDIHHKLDQCFHLLTGGDRSALPRQQTLRALIDWSYDLLIASEKRLLQRLSVFAGGWTLKDAEQVCRGESATGESIDEWEVLDLLSALVDKSLVGSEEEAAASTRYRMLDTVRQYAAEKLRASGEMERVKTRHRDWFLALAEEAEPQLIRLEQVKWLDRLETEHDNLRAALVWCRIEADAESGLKLAGALWRFWYVRGYFTEGREYLEQTLGWEGAQARTEARAKALNGAGNLASEQDENAAVEMLFKESLAIRRELGDRRGMAVSLNNLGTVACDQGDYATARTLFEENLTIFRELKDRQGIANSLDNLGAVASEQGDYEAARTLHEESLNLFRELGDRGGIAMSLMGLGRVSYYQEAYPAARAWLEQSLVLYRELGDRQGMAYSLERLAGVLLAQKDTRKAVRLWGAAHSLRERIGAPLSTIEREKDAPQRMQARSALGETDHAAAWEEGQAMPWEQAVAYALEDMCSG